MAKYTPVSPYFLGELNDGRSGYPMSDMSETRVYHMFFHVNGKKYLKILMDIQRYPIFRQYHMSKNGSAGISENEVCVCDKCHATNAISAHEIDNFPDILKKGEWVGHLLLQTVFDFYICVTSSRNLLHLWSSGFV